MRIQAVADLHRRPGARDRPAPPDRHGDDAPVFLGGDFNTLSNLDWTSQFANAPGHGGLMLEWPVTKLNDAYPFYSDHGALVSDVLIRGTGSGPARDAVPSTTRIVGDLNGTLLRATIQTSQDGTAFQDVARVEWERTTLPKDVNLQGMAARYVRVHVDLGIGGFSSAAEITPYEVSP